MLAVGCGAGEEMRLWQRETGAARITGVESRRVHVRPPAVLEGSGTALGALGLPQAGFDCVLCVDAAYHLHPRSDFLRGAWLLLRPGGRLAYTDLTLERAPGLLLRAAARLCGVPAEDLCAGPAQLQRLQAAGFVGARCEALDGAVLDGFAAFVAQQSRRIGRARFAPAWRRAAVTAALIPHARAAGLGYALLSASKPATA